MARCNSSVIRVIGLRLKSRSGNVGRSGSGAVFLTGVAFNDAVLNDDFYTVGEGLANVLI
jgi:hypothetical protein